MEQEERLAKVPSQRMCDPFLGSEIESSSALKECAGGVLKEACLHVGRSAVIIEVIMGLLSLLYHYKYNPNWSKGKRRE